MLSRCKPQLPTSLSEAAKLPSLTKASLNKAGGIIVACVQRVLAEQEGKDPPPLPEVEQNSVEEEDELIQAAEDAERRFAMRQVKHVDLTGVG